MTYSQKIDSEIKASKIIIQFSEAVIDRLKNLTFEGKSEFIDELEKYIKKIIINEINKEVKEYGLIKDGYCNGFFGHRHDLYNSLITSETKTTITLLTVAGELLTAEFNDENEKNEMIKLWTENLN